MKRERRVGEPVPIGDALPGLLRGIERAATGPVARAKAAWAEVVGPAVAARTRVVAVESGKVRVEVASAALKHDLDTFRRAEVLRGLQERLPDMGLSGLSFRVGAVS